MEHARRAGRGDPRDRPQGVPRRARWRSPARPTSSCPRTSRRWRAARADGGPAPLDARSDLLPGADRRGDRPRRRVSWRPRSGRSSWPATASCAASAAPELRALRPRAARARSRRPSWARARSTTARHLSLMAVGLQARDHVLSGFDRADLVVCVGYDLVEYAPGSLEPGRGQADHPHRHAAGRGRRRLPARGGARRRHRRDAPPAARGGPAARHRRPGRGRAPRVPGDPRPRRPAHRAARRAGRARGRRRLADQAAEGHRRPAPGARARRTSWSATSGAHKVWVARLYQAYEPNTVIISQRLRGDGHLAARARSRPSSSTRTARSSPCAATAAS